MSNFLSAKRVSDSLHIRVFSSRAQRPFMLAGQWVGQIKMSNNRRRTTGGVSGAVEFRVGTTSWTDTTLVNSDLFYPPSVRSAEERLCSYAEQFNTVEEVDSIYHALPAERNARPWTERTPDCFVF
jgi:hypothetical protein